MSSARRRLSFDEFARRITGEFGDRGVSLTKTTGLYDEFGLDSFEAFMLLLFIESLAGVDFPPDTPPALWTVGDGFNYYTQLAAGNTTHT